MSEIKELIDLRARVTELERENARLVQHDDQVQTWLREILPHVEDRKKMWKAIDELPCWNKLEAERDSLREKVQYAEEFGLVLGIAKSSDCPEGRLGCGMPKEGSELWRLERGIADLIDAQAEVERLKEEVKTVNANWDADREELEEAMANSIPLTPDESEVSAEMLAIVHEIMHCDEKTGPDGMCQCTRYIQGGFEALRIHIAGLSSRTEELAKALRIYGRHKLPCPFVTLLEKYKGDDYKCTCGLDDCIVSLKDGEENHEGKRDPDPALDCSEFEEGEPDGISDCDTDGHYMCDRCKKRDADEEVA